MLTYNSGPLTPVCSNFTVYFRIFSKMHVLKILGVFMILKMIKDMNDINMICKMEMKGYVGAM